ncbi:restriction endonuclease subunit S [Pseudomonas kunmingensis]|uniref:restriction endonuclease subunit S n=1 Tax=Stutzerimonas kunmingensis TaxID=1211807 RepID=UPI00174717E2|nr:restriction endonuclease subunit S [Stutzerimonas kunmingensis]MBD3875024.1 restriction endonuclease subunit S [Stutzerimonas kunmingensis]
MTVGASWTEVTLEDHVDLVVGYAFKSSGYTDDESDVRLLRGDNVAQGELRWDKAKRWPVSDYQRYEAFHLREGDIILAMDRPWISAGLKYARVKRKDTPSLLVQRVARLRGTESLKTDYLRCVIGSADFTDYVLSILTGVNIPHISAKDIKRFRFLLPPVPTQEKISRVITSYDDLIENNTRRIEILEEMARRLYEEWFVQFRFPGHEEKQLAFEQLNIFDIFSVKYGKGLSKKELIDGGEFPVYGAAKVIGHYHSYTYADRQIIAGCRGSVGEFRITEPKSFVTNNSFVFLPRASVDFFWGYQALKMRGLKDVIGGAAQPQITLDALQSISIPYPSSELREAYSDSVSPLFSMVWNLERKNKNLRTQRDLLLPKLISGEIDVSDIPMPT